MRSTALILILLLAAVMAATKPTDQECRRLVREQVGGTDLAGQLLGSLAVNRYTVKVEDHIFWKDIYSFTGERLGTGIFGKVILSQ